MIVKINFSKKSLVIASMGQSIVSFLVQLSLITILMIYYRILPSSGIFMLPIGAFIIIVLTCGLGLMFSLINAVVRDIANVLPIFITFMMLLTPVLYAKPKTGILLTITKYNPLYYLVSMPRNFILLGASSLLKGYLIAAGISFVVFIISLIAFHLTETRIAERI